MKRFQVILIGAGGRGHSFSDYALTHPDKFKVVAVCEPIKERRSDIQALHNIPAEMCFESWEPCLEKEKFADLVMITTMDRQHYEPCMKAIEMGYDILLEKPMSADSVECVKIAKAAKEHGTKIVVCHVLRYTPFFRSIKQFLESGRLGKIATIVHTEDVGNVHQSHSFVRGNWKNSEESCSMILQKSSHDIDILQWLIDKPCEKIQSFGSLSYFNRENKPEGSPERCIEGCPYADTCCYNAVKLYMAEDAQGWMQHHATEKPNPTAEEVRKAMWETEYGKCVYNCNNDVVDHQVVNMEFEGGITVSFTMCAYNEGGRKIRIMGTKGELYHVAWDQGIYFFDFETRQTEEVKYTPSGTSEDISGGHGGGDTGIMDELYEYLNGTYTGGGISDIEVICDNHLTTFAAEDSRLSGGQMINVKQYIAEKKQGI